MNASHSHNQYLPLLIYRLHQEENQDVHIIPAIRHLACLLLLSRFHAHTTSTLFLLRDHIEEFGKFPKVS